MAAIVKDDIDVSETNLIDGAEDDGGQSAGQDKGYTQDELDAVMDYVQTQGDALLELTEKLIAARRAYEAICWGNVTNEVVNTLVESLHDLAQDAEDFSDEVENSAWAPALKRYRKRTEESGGTYHPYQG